MIAGLDERLKNPKSPENVFDLLLPQLRRAVDRAGYQTPSPIQQKTIPPLLGGRDMLGCAQTGTGKTAAFSLPILQYLALNWRRPQSGKPRVLILAPTRELAAQIGDSIKKYGTYTKTTHAVIFGGVGQQPQVNAVRRGVQILVATPGRLLDLINQGHIGLDRIEVFVLDEADRMLDMGFIHDIKKVVAQLPEERQSLFYSATMEPPVVELARTLVVDPVHVAIDPEKPAVERIHQKVMFVDKMSKDDLIIDVFDDVRLDRVLVFTQMKHVANKVARKLEGAGISAAAIHGNKSQTARTKALAEFKAGEVCVLVATDIAARGIDVEGISHVINYDMPVEPETYVHRIGRTARAGDDGNAISFCSAPERDYLRAIEKFIRISIEVDRHHRYHCERSMHATGADARPSPKTPRPRRRVKDHSDRKFPRPGAGRRQRGGRRARG